MHVDHQQGCSRQYAASYVKEVRLSNAIKGVGCHLSHGITLPRMEFSCWRVSQVFPDKSGKATSRNFKFIPSLKEIFLIHSFSHQHNHFSVFAANTSLVHIPLLCFLFLIFFSYCPPLFFFHSSASLLIQARVS